MIFNWLTAQNEVVAGKSGNGAIVTVIVIFAVIISAMLIFAFIMKKRMDAGNDETAATGEKEETPAAKKLLDTKRLVSDVEDIVDGIVITDNGRRFVTAITSRGIDFYNENMNEQLSVVRGYQGFFSITEKPMTKRIYSKAVDIDTPKERYERRLAEVAEEYEQYAKMLQIAMEKGMEDEVTQLTPVVKQLEHRVVHLQEQLANMNFYSSTDVVMDMTQDYIFDWTYKETDIKLKKGEIFAKAKQELSTIATQKIDALLKTGVKARMCTNDEMNDLFRRHSRPLSAELYKQRLVSSSSFNEDIITSDSESIWKEAAILEDTYMLNQEYDEEDAIEYLKQKIMEEEGYSDED